MYDTPRIQLQRRQINLLKEIGVLPKEYPESLIRSFPEEEIQDRIKRNTKPNEVNGCLEWTGGTCAWGYGKICILGKSVGAHRVSWCIQNGLIPEGLYVLHKCDNPKCCNVDHLFLGTNADNMRDMALKGRARRAGHYPRTEKIRGAGHSGAKLSHDSVREIFIRGSSGERNASLAREFSVTVSAISRIRRRENWVHVTGVLSI